MDKAMLMKNAKMVKTAISMQTMGSVERMPYSAWPQKPLAP